MDINQLVIDAHEIAIEKGWWDKPRSFGELMVLIHSELSEAVEEDRHNHSVAETYYEADGKPCGIPSELADAVIRIADLCGWYGIDLDKILDEKMAYNAKRSYKHGGKAY